MNRQVEPSRESFKRTRGRGRGRGHNRYAQSTPNTTTIPPAWKDLVLNTNERHLSHVLDTLNALSYPIDGLDEQLCTNTIIQLCTNSCSRQDLIASKLCQLMTTLCAKQHIVFKQLTEAVNFLTETISTSHAWLLADSLRALGFVLSQSDVALLTTDQFKHVLETVLPSTALTVSDLEIRRQAVNVLASLCHNDKKFTKFNTAIFNACYRNFEQWSKLILTDPGLSKHVKSVLRALTNVIAIDKVHVPVIEDLTSRLSTLLFYGTLIPVKEHSMNTSISDSEYSDSEQSMSGSNREALHIRIQALQLFTACAHRDFKSMFSQWFTLYPIDAVDTLSPKSRYLTSVLLFDPSARCRSVAANCIASMLDKSKLFLAQADDEPTKSAFLPFSHKLTAMIIELHNALFYAAQEEPQGQILKCISTLVENVPYTKLSSTSGYIPKLLDIIESLLVDKTLLSHCIGVISTIFGNQQCIEQAGPYITVWLNRMIEYNDISCLANMAKNYSAIIIQEWPRIQDLLSSGLINYDSNIRVASTQLLVNLTSSQQVVDDEESLPYQSSGQLTVAQQSLNKRLSDNVAKYHATVPEDIWAWIIKNINIHDQFHGVRMNVCVVLGNTELLQNQTVQGLLSVAKNDQLVSIRAQAYRALGQLVLKQDVPLINKQVLESALAHESNVNVRIKIAWLIANYCEKSNHDMHDILIQMTHEKKLMSSAVRALGTLAPDIIPTLIPFVKEDDVKVRWNACFAIGRLGVGPAVDVLCDAICTDENFKVRIQAAAALALTKDYGSSIGHVWTSLLQAFSNPQSLSNYKELRYLKTLKDQLYHTLCHVIDTMQSCEGAEDVLVSHAQEISIILDQGQPSHHVERMIQLYKTLPQNEQVEKAIICFSPHNDNDDIKS